MISTTIFCEHKNKGYEGDCNHKKLKYCKKCMSCYCKKCGAQWPLWRSIEPSHPITYPPLQPQWEDPPVIYKGGNEPYNTAGQYIGDSLEWCYP